MAKRLGVVGGSSMLKDDLVKAVAKASRAKLKSKTDSKRKSSGKSSPSAKSRVPAPKSRVAAKSTKQLAPDKKPASKVAPKRVVSAKKNAKPKVRQKSKPTNPRVLKRIRELQLHQESTKDIAFQPTMIKPPGATEPIWEKEPQKDRVSLFVRDAYWMHASWDITRQAIERARAAMAEQWHSAKPVLRLVQLDESGNNAETVVRDVEIHGGLRNWYIDWNGEPATFRVMVGYAAPGERFHCICESNIVKTPPAGAADDVDEHWTDIGPDAEKIFALSGGYDAERETADLKEMLQDRIHRELGAPALTRLGATSDSPFNKKNEFHFDMDIEIVVYGSTTADGYLTLNGEPVTLRDDGSFAVRLPFPDRRQVLPAVACSRDGGQQRMIVVAIERNTKVMEPVEREHDATD